MTDHDKAIASKVIREIGKKTPEELLDDIGVMTFGQHLIRVLGGTPTMTDEEAACYDQKSAPSP